MKFNDPNFDRFIAIGFSQLRFFPSTLKYYLIERGLWEDLQQTVYVSAVEAWRLGFDPDANVKEISNRVQKEIYLFLKGAGYRRPRGSSGYILTEEPFENIERWRK